MGVDAARRPCLADRISTSRVSGQYPSRRALRRTRKWPPSYRSIAGSKPKSRRLRCEQDKIRSNPPDTDTLLPYQQRVEPRIIVIHVHPLMAFEKRHHNVRERGDRGFVGG